MQYDIGKCLMKKCWYIELFIEGEILDTIKYVGKIYGFQNKISSLKSGLKCFILIRIWEYLGLKNLFNVNKNLVSKTLAAKQLLANTIDLFCKYSHYNIWSYYYFLVFQVHNKKVYTYEAGINWISFVYPKS